MRPVEGYYLETVEGLLFAVKGLHHPEDGVVAYLRYIPDEEGERIRGGRRYRRVYDLQETTDYLRERHPQYLRWMEERGITVQLIPLSSIRRVYDPREGLREVLEKPEGRVESLTARLVEALIQRGTPLEDMGLTGSLLIGLGMERSDIDLVVYGRESGLKAFRGLKTLRERGVVSELTPGETLKVAEERWGAAGLDLERGKLFHGLMEETPYFIRLVPNPWEVERTVSRPLGSARVRGVVVDDAEAIYTPCLYRVEAEAGGERVVELMSYRGRFTEQVRVGERFEARGTLEEVHSSRGIYYRLMMGGRGDYLIPLGLLGAT